MPSIVGFTEDDDRLVGQIAKRQAVTNPQNTIFAVKRLIGRKFDDPEVQRAREVLPYTLTRAPNGDIRVKIGNREYSPQEISALILDRDQELRPGRPGRRDHRRDHHRARLLRRLAAPGHQRRRPHRRARGAPHHQRADRRRPRLRFRQKPREPDRRGLRPRRRHLRHLDPRALGRRVRGARGRRRQLPRRRGLRPADHGLADRRVPQRDRDRPAQRPHGSPAPQRGRRAGQMRAFDRRGSGHQPALHLGRRAGPAPPLAHPHPQPFRSAGARAGRPYRRALHAGA